ncbi:facilitated trehalose transporter Tret1-like [Macrosteles quadrilineatus]|uniref:facilitated trehalose transporter Tret1-like n=1 Tax=Macrosteles quadrilineatus TaxID=74068 RepID=UPI0023E145CE|nr:facilitated trehalose transporter Tret1-like [Macrosteles quadrilineatus]
MEEKKKFHRQWMAAIISTIALFMIGMYSGWPSPAMEHMTTPDSEVFMTEDQISWMVAVVYIGSTVSPVAAGWLMNCLGRRLTLMMLTSVALASWIILATVKSPTGVYIARFLGGVWGGTAYTVLPIYLCEIAEPEVRGALNTLFMLIAYMGIMFEYCIGPKVSYTELAYISACVPAAFFLLLFFIPESPYFYLMKNDRERAGKTLAWLRSAESPNEIENDLSVIEKAVLADMQNKGRLKNLVSTAGNRKALLIAEMLAVLQRMSGIGVVMAYASEAIPPIGGFTSDDSAMLLCFTWIVFGFASTFLVNWTGRRILLVVSCLGCALGHAMVAGWFYLDSNTSYDAMSIAWFPLLSFMIFSIFYPIGLGCIPPMIQGEMFPSNTRGLASGVTTATGFLTSFITNKTYFNIGELAGFYVSYAVFSVSCLFGVYFSLAVVIETKDRTLEDIQIELSELTIRKQEKKKQKTQEIDQR